MTDDVVELNLSNSTFDPEKNDRLDFLRNKGGYFLLC